MRVRVIVPVAFNGTHRVYEGRSTMSPMTPQLGSWAERIDDTATPVKQVAKRSKAAPRAADESVI